MKLALKITSNVDQAVEKIQHRTYRTTENVETIASTIPSNVMEHVLMVTLLVVNIAM